MGRHSHMSEHPYLKHAHVASQTSERFTLGLEECQREPTLG